MRPRESTSNLLAEAIRFLDVVRHQQCRPQIGCKRILKQRFYMSSQMGIESRKRFVEQQRFRF